MFVDTYNNAVRYVTPDGVMEHLAGNYNRGAGGDNGPATSALVNRPQGVCIDAAGYVHIVDTGNSYVRYVSLTTATMLAYAGMQQDPGFSGDGGAATSAQLNAPSACAIDAAGTSVLIADTGNHRIRSVNIATNVSAA